MKTIITLFLVPFLFCSSYSQNNFLKTDINISEYFVDTLYSQINFCFSNYTDSIYILWFDRDNQDSLSNNQKIRKHFHTTSGDMTFMQMIWDGNVTRFVPGLFNSFMKIINPGEQFIVSIVKKGKTKANSEYFLSIKKNIVIVNAREIKGMKINENLNMFNFHPKCVSIFAEWLE